MSKKHTTLLRVVCFLKNPPTNEQNSFTYNSYGLKSNVNERESCSNEA